MSTEKKIWLLFALFIGLFAFGIYNAFKPDMFPMSFIRGEARKINDNIIVGPYPTEDEILKLKDNGVEEVISLMDDSSPVEAGLVDRERVLTERYNIKFLIYPMDFIRLNSENNKKRLASLIEHILSVNDKTLYIHCYLGRHRIALLEKELKKSLIPAGLEGK